MCYKYDVTYGTYNNETFILLAMRISVFALISISIFSSIRAQPERVWEVQQLTEPQEKNSGSPTFLNSRPLKIRLVNYEQRQLVLRQQGKGQLDTLRQKARGGLFIDCKI